MQKIFYILTIIGTADLVAENTTYDAAISRVISTPSVEAVIELGGHLRGVARYNQPSGSNPYYYKIQQTLISIPGHARYFQQEIKRGQEAVKDLPTSTGPRVSYDGDRARYFETLSQLPSPEAIAVLGDFLSDDIDTPHPLVSEDSDWGENPRANSFASSFSIARIGLRNEPATLKSYDADPEAHLATTRAWWEEVKSGRKAFSFKGQDVEYRFKPDGTWETIALENPPDDMLEMKESSVKERPPVKSPPGDQMQKEETQGRNPWLWICGLGVVLLGLIALIGRRFKKH